MSRLKPGLNAEDLFAKGPRRICGDLRTFRSSLLVLGLDHLDRGYRMAWEEVCMGTRKKKERTGP